MVYIASTSRIVYVALNGNGGTLDAPSLILFSGSVAKFIAIEDIDADGTMDLVMRVDNEIFFYTNDGTGAFTYAILTVDALDSSDALVPVLLFDVNLDGKLDVVYSYASEGVKVAVQVASGEDWGFDFEEEPLLHLPDAIRPGLVLSGATDANDNPIPPALLLHSMSPMDVRTPAAFGVLGRKKVHRLIVRTVSATGAIPAFGSIVAVQCASACGDDPPSKRVRTVTSPTPVDPHFVLPLPPPARYNVTVTFADGSVAVRPFIMPSELPNDVLVVGPTPFMVSLHARPALSRADTSASVVARVTPPLPFASVTVGVSTASSVTATPYELGARGRYAFNPQMPLVSAGESHWAVAGLPVDAVVSHAVGVVLQRTSVLVPGATFALDTSIFPETLGISDTATSCGVADYRGTGATGMLFGAHAGKNRTLLLPVPDSGTGTVSWELFDQPDSVPLDVMIRACGWLGACTYHGVGVL